MKKIFFSLLAIAALASCAKTEPTFTEVDSEIKIAPVTAVSTKAVTGAIDGTQYPAAEAFKVYAHWNTAGAGSDFNSGTLYLNNVKFVNKGAYWGGETTYYWPKNGSLRFSAYSPADLSMTHDLGTDTYTLGTIEYPTVPANAYDILVAPTSESYTAETAAEKVSVVFEHALSWISFKIQSTVVANEVFDVKEVIVNDVAYKGSLVANMTAGTKVWTLGNDVNPVTVFTGSQLAKSTAASIDANDNLVLPQTPTTVTVKYTQNEMSHTDDQGNKVVDSPALANQSITVPLVLDNENDKWEPGKHYTYTILFDLDEILINPSVEDWEETAEVIVNSDPVKVSSPAELVAAVAEGKNVVLEENITLEEPVIVKPVVATKAETVHEVTIDLNGKDIIAPLFAESDGNVTDGDTDSYAFWVKEGGKLTINGNGNVTTQACTYSIAVWAQGGEVVINGGTYANAGEGSDLIYASAGGKVTVNGGTFNANKKQAGVVGNNNEYSALNLKDNTGSTIIVYGGTFYNFNPADNLSEGPGTNFVATGYNVVQSGEWYTVTAPKASTTLTGNSVVYGSFNVNDAVFDGAGYDVDVPATLTDNGLFRPAGNATIKNVNIDGNNQSWNDNGTSRGIRAIYITKAGNYVIDNVVVENATYAINVNTTQTVKLTVKNSTLAAWTSYGGTTTADFTNVKFENGKEQTYRPYGTTVLTGCSFAEGFIIDLGSMVEGATIVFDNCTYGGKPLAAANLTNAEGKAYSIR